MPPAPAAQLVSLPAHALQDAYAHMSRLAGRLASIGIRPYSLISGSTSFARFFSDSCQPR